MAGIPAFPDVQEQLSASAGAEQRAEHRQVTALQGWILAAAKLPEQVLLGVTSAVF